MWPSAHVYLYMRMCTAAITLPYMDGVELSHCGPLFYWMWGEYHTAYSINACSWTVCVCVCVAPCQQCPLTVVCVCVMGYSTSVVDILSPLCWDTWATDMLAITNHEYCSISDDHRSPYIALNTKTVHSLIQPGCLGPCNTLPPYRPGQPCSLPNTALVLPPLLYPPTL